jgi:putative redox protein
MKSTLKWTTGMQFEAVTDGNAILMDAKSPIGKGQAQTPKELIAAGLGGCTAMDVIALLKKHKQTYESLTADINIETTQGVQPMVFTAAHLLFRAKGAIQKDILLDAVRLSQTKYCGVSAMLVKAFPIKYSVELNGELIGEGAADFGG